MTQAPSHPIVELIGEESFAWLSGSFSKATTLEDVPGEILDRVSHVNAVRRDFASDPAAVTAIALVTFAYSLAGKPQEARYGSNDLLLVKVLTRAEMARRNGERTLDNPLWKVPLHELITGEVGDRIRATRFMTNPGCGPE